MVSLLNFTAIAVPRRPNLRTTFMAAHMTNTEQLRTQLDQLHIEAEKTRAKANNARLRLMRLSEAAEKLQRQAALDVQIGKENEARELLVQKRKVMQALEKSKSRIELLDGLLGKLNEAISVKETQLIGNVALGLEVDREDASGTVRIISPKDTSDDSNVKEGFDPFSVKHAEDQELQLQEESEANLLVNHQQEDIEEGNVSMSIWNESDLINSLKGISSFEDFLEHVDQQLKKIEVELVTVLRLSTLVLEREEKPKNPKLQQTLNILENVRGIRGRRDILISTEELLSEVVIKTKELEGTLLNLASNRSTTRAADFKPRIIEDAQAFINIRQFSQLEHNLDSFGKLF